MVQKFGLSRRSTLTRVEDDSQITFIMNAPAAHLFKYYGYIRFSKIEGTVELTNRGASLRPEYLSLGATTKAHDLRQAGFHGEGMKIAFLVMLRKPQNHRVTIMTGGFRWHVEFSDSGRLSVRITRINETERQHIKEIAARARSSDLPAADCMDDVQIIVGETNDAPAVERDQHGTETQKTSVDKKSSKNSVDALSSFSYRTRSSSIPPTEGN